MNEKNIQQGNKQTGRQKQVERIDNYYSALDRISVNYRLTYNSLATKRNGRHFYISCQINPAIG